MEKVLVLQHHPVENLCNIAEALAGASLAWQYVRVFEGQTVPANMKGAGGLIVMGGPMGVYQLDRYPFLRDEMRLIEDAVANNRPVLGVCLGAQIVAAALGAKVERNPAGKEIGWHQIRLEPAAKEDRLFRGLAESLTPFHWHGDAFELPAGAVALAASTKTPCQAFRFGTHVYALQFHLEVTQASVAAMAAAFARELEREKIDAVAMTADWDSHGAALERLADNVFSRWAAPVFRT
ncbi:MAG TPA: type 1 glutamine amidotransferase [Candidatus Binataceae bacterium]